MKINEEVKSMPKHLEKDSNGLTRDPSESRFPALREAGSKKVPTEKGVRIRMYPNPKVPPKPSSNEKGSTNGDT